jgi:hypothetical protein
VKPPASTLSNCAAVHPASAQEGYAGSLGFPKLNLTTKEAMRAIGSPRLFQRLRYHRWIQPLFPSRDALYPWTRIKAAQERMERGDLPPLLPSEIKAKAMRLSERQCAA